MMQIARLHLKGNTENESGDDSEEEKKTWNYILENYSSWEEGGVKPLYLTQRGHHRDISLIVSSNSTDDFAEYILKNLSGMDTIKDIWVLNLIQPTFFAIPDNISQNLKRFTITLDVVPNEAKSVYQRISKIKPTSSTIITYVTYTFQRNSDILISLLAGSEESVSEFVRDYLEGLKGVIKSDVIPITKSKNLASSGTWKDSMNRYFYTGEHGQEEDLRIYKIWSSMGFE